MTKSVYSETYNLENGSQFLIEYTRSTSCLSPKEARRVGNLLVSQGDIRKEFRVTKNRGGEGNCEITFDADKCGQTTKISNPPGSTRSRFSREEMLVDFKIPPGGWDIAIRESTNLFCGNLIDGGDVAIKMTMGRILSLDGALDLPAYAPDAWFLDNRAEINDKDKPEDRGLLQVLKGVGGVGRLQVLYTPAGQEEPEDFTDAFMKQFEGHEILAFGMI